MQTVDLKLIVEALSKCSGDFAKQYELFKASILMELPDEYDKFLHGIDECYEVLSVVIGTTEVDNIKNRM